MFCFVLLILCWLTLELELVERMNFLRLVYGDPKKTFGVIMLIFFLCPGSCSFSIFSFIGNKNFIERDIYFGFCWFCLNCSYDEG